MLLRIFAAVLICTILAITPDNASAQFSSKQNRVWIFGRNAGLNFATGSPVPISSSIFTDEGCATLADTAGNLLFYTTGDSVWNRNNVVMPNGSGIAPFSCNSGTQASVITPIPGSPSRFYVFSLEHILTNGRFAYSIVDMSLDGGLGDVVSTSKGVMIDSGFAEKMLTVRGDCCMWVIVHRQDSAKFYAYKITSTGIDLTPVISDAGTDPFYVGYGVIKISPNRKKIALTHFDVTGGASRVELYDFNTLTGAVSNRKLISTRTNPYGAEFSGDNSNLYVHHWTDGKIYQYDATLTTESAIVATEFEVTSGIPVASDMRLGPDSVIYISSTNSFLDRILQPNLSGSACNYERYAIDLSPGQCVIGLPALYWADSACPSGILQPGTSSLSDLVVYPNPAKDKMTLLLPAKGSYEIELLDITGRVRKSEVATDADQLVVDISELPAGNYLLHVTGENGSYRKVITVLNYEL